MNGYLARATISERSCRGMVEHVCSSTSVIADTIRNPTTAGELIANVYKTIVQAISETSTVAAGTDATG
jgi:hypothetical protein